MGFRFQKRMSVIPGLRLNLSKRGASLSVGRRGGWFTMGSQGTRATVGIPGTGMSWTETGKAKRVRQTEQTQQQPPPSDRIPNDTVITVPRDQADAICNALHAQGYQTTLRSNIAA